MLNSPIRAKTLLCLALAGSEFYYDLLMKHLLPFYWQVFVLSPFSLGWENDSLLYLESHFHFAAKVFVGGAAW